MYGQVSSSWGETRPPRAHEALGTASSMGSTAPQSTRVREREGRPPTPLKARAWQRRYESGVSRSKRVPPPRATPIGQADQTEAAREGSGASQRG